MTNSFKAKVRPELGPYAQSLVDVYNATFGSCSPGCCPEAVAAVLEALAQESGSISRQELLLIANGLRGVR